MLGLVFACSSCHDVVVRDTPQNVFEVFWTTLDEHYVYFEEKGVDWDSMYVAYAPRARQVHTDAELLSLLHEMIVPLQDGHVSIVAGDTVVYSKRVRYSVENKEYYSPYLGALNSVRDTKSIWGRTTMAISTYSAIVTMRTKSPSGHVPQPIPELQLSI